MRSGGGPRLPAKLSTHPTNWSRGSCTRRQSRPARPCLNWAYARGTPATSRPTCIHSGDDVRSPPIPEACAAPPLRVWVRARGGLWGGSASGRARRGCATRPRRDRTIRLRLMPRHTRNTERVGDSGATTHRIQPACVDWRLPAEHRRRSRRLDREASIDCARERDARRRRRRPLSAGYRGLPVRATVVAPPAGTKDGSAAPVAHAAVPIWLESPSLGDVLLLT